jgi:hypothetical protein
MSKFTHFDLPAQRTRRFTVVLAAETFSELSVLAEQSGRTPAEVVQMGLDLLKMARDETVQGRVLAIAARDGTPLKQIVIPA